MWIELKAVAKQRARLTRARRGRRSRAYTPQKTKHFEDSLAEAYRSQGGTHWGAVPVGLQIEIYKDGFDVQVFPLECSVRPVGIRGDVDNYVKAIQDGLNGVAWNDDRQVEMLVVHFVGAPRKGTEYNEATQLQGTEYVASDNSQMLVSESEGEVDNELQGRELGGTSCDSWRP